MCMQVIILNDYSTVVVPRKLKNKLDDLKEHERESYAQVIEKMILQLKELDESKLELSEDTLKAIEEGKQDLIKGKVYTSKQLAKELGF